jgi:N-methylhydantoinase A
LHGGAVGRALGCAAVYVPRLAGVFCAFGMGSTDVRIDRLRSWYRRLGDARPAELDDAFAEVEQQATQALVRQGFAPDAIVLERSLALRYTGQQWPVVIGCDRPVDPAAVRESFQSAHQRLFGHFQPGGEIEILNLKVAARGRLTLHAPVLPAGASTAAPEARSMRPVWISEAVGTVATPIHDGAGLRPGHSLTGPAIVDEQTTTLLVDAGQRLNVTAGGNYLIVPSHREVQA